jgi:hypothetical protein
MYLNSIYISADPELVERYRGGFVGRFNSEVCCITTHYEKLVWRKVNTVNTGAVVFVFTDSIKSPPTEYGVHNCKWPFPFVDYMGSSTPQKKRMILDALHAALLWISKKEQWDSSAFKEAHQQILRNDLQYEGMSKRSWLSPNRRFRAKIHFNFNLDEVAFSVVLLRARSAHEVSRMPLGKVKPFEDALSCVDKAAWISPTQFQVKSSPNSFVRFEWTADFSEAISAIAGG